MSRLVLAFAALAAAFSAIALVTPPAFAGEAPRPRPAVLPAERAPVAAADGPVQLLVLPLPTDPIGGQRAAAGAPERPERAMPVEAGLPLPRPWSCGTVVAGGRPAPIGDTGYAVYPLSLGDGGGTTRYGYCVYPAAARTARQR